MPLRSKTSKSRKGATRRARPAASRSKTAKTARLAPSTTKAVQAIVARTIGRAAETKFVSSYAADATPNVYTGFNSVIQGASQWSSGMPPLVQGQSSYTRNGEQVSPRQNKVAVDVRLRPDVDPVDITVVCYWGVCKKYKTYADVVTNSITLCTDLLKLGGGERSWCGDPVVQWYYVR